MLQLIRLTNMSGYKKSILERQSTSEVKMDRGSGITKLWSNFRIMTLNILLFKVVYFCKRSRESQDISVHEGHDKNQYCVSDFQAFGQHCVKNIRLCHGNRCISSEALSEITVCEHSCIFQQDNDKSHTEWLRTRRVWELGCPACSTFGTSRNTKNNKEDLGLLS